MKIKIKSLAAEAAIIRKDERKATGDSRNSLHLHRTIELRREARAALLAYAFLRKRAYSQIERPNSRPIDWKRVAQIARKFGASEAHTEDMLKAWAEPLSKAA